MLLSENYIYIFCNVHDEYIQFIFDDYKRFTFSPFELMYPFTNL